MFRWLDSLCSPAARTPTRRPLLVEAHERRDTPAAPSLTLHVEAIAGNMVSLTGTVTDENPSGVVVNFDGVISGSTPANSNGSYALLTQASTLGTVTAQATDDEGLTSEAVQEALTSNPPTLTLTRTYGPYRQAIFSGQVTDEAAFGRTVTFSGAAAGSVQTDSYGNFTFMTSQWSPGTVTAQTSDPWGQVSNTPTATLTQTAPVITEFTATPGADGMWIFQGRVSDEYAGMLTVRLGGLPSLNNITASVASDGYFIRVLPLAPGESGTAWAQVTDWWGVTSSFAYAFVWQAQGENP
jgi:hypothetical protein